jgi:hypothetical protein
MSIKLPATPLWNLLSLSGWLWNKTRFFNRFTEYIKPYLHSPTCTGYSVIVTCFSEVTSLGGGAVYGPQGTARIRTVEWMIFHAFLWCLALREDLRRPDLPWNMSGWIFMLNFIGYNFIQNKLAQTFKLVTCSGDDRFESLPEHQLT